MRKPPYAVEVIWANGLSRDYSHSSWEAARDFVKNGIAWSNGNVRFARIYDDAGEPVALESADTVGRIS